MKRRIDYASMNWFEKRRVLRLERKVQNRKRKADLKAAHPGGGGISWFKVLIFIALIAAAYYYREQIIGFIKGLF